MTIALAIALPGAALAQGAPLQMQGHFGQVYGAGVVRGSVVDVSVQQGLVLVRARRGLVRLSAMPSQLAGLNPGDVIRFPYASYAGALWVSPEFGGGQSRFWGNYGQQARFSGAIQRINVARGVIVIDGQRFRIHPAQLQGVVPGEFVRIHAVRVGAVAWVTGLRHTPRARIGWR